MNNINYRYEIKYFMENFDYELIRSKLRLFMNSDSHSDDNGEYRITSLYFDDVYNSAYNEKMNGLMFRKKFRIRIYNYDDKSIKLEQKIKHGQLGYKKNIFITKDDFYRIINGDTDFLKNSDSPLLREFYIKTVNNVLKPDVIVDYVREAYVLDVSDIRITFDKNIRSSNSSYDIFDRNLPMMNSVESYVMEVKYNNFLPDYIKKIIGMGSRNQQSISKFVSSKIFA